MKKVQDVVEVASKKAKIFCYDDILAFRPILIKECNLGVSQRYCFGKMKQYAQELRTYGLLGVSRKKFSFINYLV